MATNERYPFVFRGDGRKKILPHSAVLPMTAPLAVTASEARRLIDKFEADGITDHSGRGAVLWVVLLHCQLNGIGYVLRAHPGRSYEVRKDDAP
jgi:hypothetical protein